MKRSRRRGLTLVEVAILLPLLLVLILGILEYGWLFLKAQQISNAARQGARAGARADATVGEITTAVADAMAAAGLAGSGYSLTVQPGDTVTVAPGDMISVEVSVPYANIGLSIPLVPTPANLDSEVVMEREGPV